MKTLRPACVLLLAAALPTSASSGEEINYTTINCLTCNPLPASEPMLARALTGWRFASGQVGTVELLCPLPTIQPAEHVTDFELVYTEPDGTGTGTQVHATLRRVHDTATAATVVC